MTPEIYQRVCQICYDAIGLEMEQLTSYLDRTCCGDVVLRGEVEAMLAYRSQVESFLTSRALAIVAGQMARDLESEQKLLPFNHQRTTDADSPIPEIYLGLFAVGVGLDGRYSIEKELAQGGTCAIFLARDRKLHQTPVVIKVLLKIWHQTVHKEWYEKKFKEEIMALTRIDHPGVVRALDIGELADGRTYLVMQYVSGVNLRTIITPEGMDFGQVANLMRQIGRAVSAAHQQGVIHRDLKPENIMLQNVGDEQYVKLIDFGIATVCEMTGADEGRTTEIIGTRNYLAPEQLRGRPVAASDVYAMGVIAYEMITGRQPFSPDSITHLYELQRDGVKVKPRELRPRLPEAAQTLILKALSFAPEDRFTNAKDFTDALATALIADGLRGLSTSPKSSVRRRRLLIAALIVLSLIGIAALRYFNISGRFKSGLTSPPFKARLERQLSYSLEAQRDPARYPGSKQFLTFDNVIFGAGDQIRLYIGSPQPGALYIINEGPTQTDGLPNYNILFPDTQIKGGSSKIQAGQIVQFPAPSGNLNEDWFIFDHEEGIEKIWLVWSEQAIPELEAFISQINPNHRGSIVNSKQRASVAHYLTGHATIRPDVEKDEISKQTRVKVGGESLVWLIKLEHH